MLFYECAYLLVHVKRNIIMPAAILAAGTGTFPAAEGLEARPCACGCALWTVGIGHAGLNVVVEPISFFEGSIEACGETVVYVVGDLHGLVHAFYFSNGCDGQEHFLFPQAVTERQVGDQGVFTEISFIEHAASFYVSAGEEFSAALIDLFTEILEIIIGRLIYHRTAVRVSFSWVADD